MHAVKSPGNKHAQVKHILLFNKIFVVCKEFNQSEHTATSEQISMDKDVSWNFVIIESTSRG